ncbi:Retrovirus-related Pol polyprotein from transposon TNT 1-94 Includes: RecName: Full=Protease [Rhizoctonia solani AG-1 IB]|uniref:Rhizoctonia solani AG1-IB WGS project CAOJ00000000 data, isolate 7/3/14, contig 10758 n=1 Tax=Thanatephorus cucumeris (strain AG1-IB / isolate 7/3/14) TaxID=1108050 RepID=M5BWJ0_THACB|nr:Retrovirus-related Pol polyprotein from transposon TNT 1-94 Includes: RecName: Full=Protease [Rhizoctonia solani AG-1 IB]
MRIDSGMADKYWGYAILHAANVSNVTPKRFLNGRTPEEVFTGKKPDVSRLRIFGCKAWARIPENKRSKLQARSIECRYLGYAPNRKAHILVDHATGKIITSRDVVFDEGGETRQRIIIEDFDNEVPEGVGDAKNEPKDATESFKGESKPEKVEPKSEASDSEPDDTKSTSEAAPEPSEAPSTPPRASTPPPRRSGRVTRPPERYGARVGAQDEAASFANAQSNEFALTTVIDTPPKTFEEAMSRPDAHLWLESMIEELASIEKHGVWKRANRPEHRLVIECMWVFSFKRGPDGEIVRYKARLVAKGYSQRPGVDFEEISSPVAASDAFRVVLSKVTELDLELLQLDIKTAFLHGVLEEEIYMEQPEGFKDSDGSVWRLKKALYGLKQAARAFYLRLREVLVNLRFTRCETDHAVFWRREGENLAIILAHVDDMLLAGKPRAYLEDIKAEMAKSFDIVDLGEPQMFVGVEIERDRKAGTLKISQRRYIEDILKRFGMENCKPCVTPMAEVPNLPKLDAPTVNRTLYQRGIGSLMYAMISTRGDIAYATGLLAQHAANPGEEHWKALQRVLRYLRGSTNLGIIFDRSRPSELVGFVDADYAGDPNTSRSTSGWIFKMTGGSIAWSSRKQPTISLSSTEAEYVAAASAARELIWVRGFLSELGFTQNGPTVVYTDNQSSMALSKNPGNHQNTKHIRVKYHFIREMIELKEIELKFIPTDEQIADMLTKPLGRVKFPTFVSGMGIS